MARLKRKVEAITKRDTWVQIPEPIFRPKSNIFYFFEDEKKTQNFVRTNFKHFDIYKNEKHILTF